MVLITFSCVGKRMGRGVSSFSRKFKIDRALTALINRLSTQFLEKNLRVASGSFRVGALATGATERAIASEMDNKNKIVMVADPDPYTRELVGRYIDEAGYEVTFATDGYEALDSARRSPPTVILADVLLPRLDGLALCRILKGDPATESIITVIVYSVIAAESRARKAGADAFVQKPLEKNRLLKALDEASKKRVSNE